jgi:hypothetical protein
MTGVTQLFNFQWLAPRVARSLFLLFPRSSRRRLFINQSFFEQSIRRPYRAFQAAKVC